MRSTAANPAESKTIPTRRQNSDGKFSSPDECFVKQLLNFRQWNRSFAVGFGLILFCGLRAKLTGAETKRALTRAARSANPCYFFLMLKHSARSASRSISRRFFHIIAVFLERKGAGAAMDLYAIAFAGCWMKGLIRRLEFFIVTNVSAFVSASLTISSGV